ncbi:DUF4176 domain-containing protein [Candidatus Enterococcus murrayae]|uniref:DUF4176 domain-containing protein n=1 Tax=Candidatus Enterococcus murrayae TaxID=2815321 RepID=A0ABS3HBX6_9ENTE|nr:DUF4176 domain-containing protein [Enterococcus sp. MJM16]MBO0450955.1 DUF4176 domain-containing protein [Enterococcus sp. MJM16]
MEIYPIGTVVTLIDGEQQLMITSRFPLYENQGNSGYFDYAGCIFPQGQINENNYFFNEEDIKIVHFEGYKSEEEIKLRKDLMKQVPLIRYPKLSVNDTY